MKTTTKMYLILGVMAVLAMLFLAACTAGPNPSAGVPDAAGKGAGFWTGLWNGIISPVSFVISLFSNNVNVYDVYNNGNWYDFVFILGIAIIFGGGGSRAKCKRK